jgi:hypothetical protein
MAETKATTVNTEEKEKKVEEALSVKDFAEDTKHVVKAPVFIMFAEYLGLVSKVIDWAEDWCNGNKPDDYKAKIIETDAICLFNQAKKKYTEDELAEWYDLFYEVILSDFDNNLKNLEAKQSLT